MPMRIQNNNHKMAKHNYCYFWNLHSVSLTHTQKHYTKQCTECKTARHDIWTARAPAIHMPSHIINNGIVMFMNMCFPFNCCSYSPANYKYVNTRFWTNFTSQSAKSSFCFYFFLSLLFTFFILTQRLHVGSSI